MTAHIQEIMAYMEDEMDEIKDALNDTAKRGVFS
jgi:hypothetical protein